MFGKARELEERVEMQAKELEAREKELASLQATLASLNTQLDGHRARESAVVSAMAEVERIRAQKLAEADARAQEICKSAQEKQYAAQRSADELLASARAQAEAATAAARAQAEAAIAAARTQAGETVAAARAQADALLADAQKQAAQTLARADEATEESRRSAERLNAKILRVAEEAKAQVAALADSVSGLQIPGAASDMPAPQDTDYDNPASVMQGIYMLEGRDIPTQAQRTPVDKPAEAPLAATVREETPEAAKTPEAVRAPETPEAVKAPETPEKETEERLWTVDEIIDSVLENEKEDLGADGALDQLIQDILQ